MSKQAGKKDVLIRTLAAEIAVKDEIILEFLKIATVAKFVLPKTMTDVLGALYYNKKVDEKFKKVLDFAKAKASIEGKVYDKESTGSTGQTTPKCDRP
jgi:hypothetical protein